MACRQVGLPAEAAGELAVWCASATHSVAILCMLPATAAHPQSTP